MGANERELAANVHRVAIHLLRSLRREDSKTGLSGPRLSALSVIVYSGPTSLTQLADSEQVRAPTMSRIVDALVEMGLATRNPDPRDGRGIRVTATRRGRKLMDAGQERRVRVLAERLSTLTSSERATLEKGIELLKRVVP